MDAFDGTWAPKSPDLNYAADGQHTQTDVPVHPQHQGYRGSISGPVAGLPFSPPASSPSQYAKSAPPWGMPPAVDRHESMQSVEFTQSPADIARGKRREGNGSANSSLPPGAENVNITVHFPVARIKRIMQADDDVGKVAQVTPVVVSKALELFMISLVTKAASEAKARSSKRVNAVHLKQAIVKDEQFDFLNEIVAKVADAPAAEKSDPDAEHADGKKRKTPARRKRKTDDDDF